MDISASEWSSGCESGWTHYLDEPSQSLNQYHQKGTRKTLVDHHQSYREHRDQEEDLSMVSDASSGPPHFRYEDEGEDEVGCFRQPGSYFPSYSEKSKKKKGKEPRLKHQQHSFLDDTASSPALSYPNRFCMDPSNNQPSIDHLFDFSQGNGFTGNTAFGDQLGFWQSSHARQQDPAEPSRSRGRRRG